MTTIGNRGGLWRASVSMWGSVEPWDASPPVDWWLAADDRWHTPRVEPTVRQRLLDGAPVVETAVRVPGGDALQRVYAVADAGGLLAVEVENASPLPFAVAFSRSDVLAARPATDVPVRGIELPPGSVVFPVGHRATIRVAYPHTAVAGRRSPRLPAAVQVARGWVAQTEVGARIEVPDDGTGEALVRARSSLLLEGPSVARDDPAGFVLGAVELARLGEAVDDQLDEVAAAVGRLARATRRAAVTPWDTSAAIDGAVELFARAGDERALGDVLAMAAALPPAGPLPADAPDDAARLVAWWLRRLVVAGPGGVEVLPELPPAWRGQSVAAYGVPTPIGRVSFAVRWHGDRPALLWELEGVNRLRCPGLDPSWSTTAPTGETLLRSLGGGG